MREKAILQPPPRTAQRRLPMALYCALLLSPLPLLLVHIWGPRFGVNLTESMPRGLYWRSPVTTLQRGNMVIACIPRAYATYARRAGYLPDGTCNGISLVIKYIAGIGGDDVALTARGVFINGNRLPGSVPLPYDSSGRVIPHIPFRIYHLKRHEVWLYSPKPHSFDSRYYGPLKTESLKALAHAVITVP